MTNEKLLRESICRSGYKMTFIAKKLGISYQAFLNKVNNISEFKASEIQKLSDLLKIEKKEKENIFFANKVDETSTK